eukprot:1393074-Pyramimonas_sp.AAC.1
MRPCAHVIHTRDIVVVVLRAACAEINTGSADVFCSIPVLRQTSRLRFFQLLVEGLTVKDAEA